MGRGPMAVCLAQLSRLRPRGQRREEQEPTHSSALTLSEGGNRALLLPETSTPVWRESEVPADSLPACLPQPQTGGEPTRSSLREDTDSSL